MDVDNVLFHQAVAFVNNTNKNIFITGRAGTGKTTFLKHIRSVSYKNTAIVAPTGVAAINAGGVTIHSFLQLPFGMFIPSHKTVWGGEASKVYNRNELISNLRIFQAKRDIIKSLELLIIDEVSMVRADLLDAIDTVLRSVRRKQNEPFGGVQVVLIGDMHQLPPVVKNEEEELLLEHYSSPFFFSAKVMEQSPPVYIELKKIYRQSDQKFINLLQNVRNNRCTTEDLELLNSYYNPYFKTQANDGFITLSTHNFKTDEINGLELNKLPGKIVELSANVQGDFPESAYPADNKLRLKLGAQIMFIKNDVGVERRFYNGKIGRVEAIDPKGENITISFPNEQEKIIIEPEIWKNVKYKLDKDTDSIKEDEVGQFIQFPIRLAWAITIHKSQGLTFDKAVIDAGAAFASGQVYVALSRLRSIEGLVLKSRIPFSAIKTDEQVNNYAEHELPPEELNSYLQAAQEEYIVATLLKTFDWDESLELLYNFLKDYEKRSIQDVELAYRWCNDLISAFNNINVTAKKYHLFIENQISIGPSCYPLLNAKTIAGADWFANQMEEKILKHFDEHKTHYATKSRTKKYLTEIASLRKHFERIKHKIKVAAKITQALADNQQISEIFAHVQNMYQIPVSKEAAMLPITKAGKTPVAGTAILNTKAVKDNQKVASKELSLKLYKSGKSAKEIAKERNLAVSTITGHLISYIGSGEIKIQDFVSDEKRKLITHAIMSSAIDIKFSELKEILGDEFSYDDIKAVYSFIESTPDFQEKKRATDTR